MEKMILRDVQTDKEVGVFLGQWLALDEGDMEINKVCKCCNLSKSNWAQKLFNLNSKPHYIFRAVQRLPFQLGWERVEQGSHAHKNDSLFPTLRLLF